MDLAAGTQEGETCFRVKYLPKHWADGCNHTKDHIMNLLTAATGGRVVDVDSHRNYTMIVADTEQQYSYAYVTFGSEHRVDELAHLIQQVKIGGKYLGASLHTGELHCQVSDDVHDHGNGNRTPVPGHGRQQAEMNCRPRDDQVTGIDTGATQHEQIVPHTGQSK